MYASVCVHIDITIYIIYIYIYNVSQCLTVFVAVVCHAVRNRSRNPNFGKDGDNVYKTYIICKNKNTTRYTWYVTIYIYICKRMD